MLKMLTKNRHGFTIVELLVVLVLLSFGVLALANMFKVTYRAFNKAEERSIKQEAVKTVAEMLREGQTNVASAMSADIFADTSVMPTLEPDKTYSYLYFEPNIVCKECEAAWDSKNNRCSAIKSTENVTDQDGNTETQDVYCSGARKVDGYFIKCLNKGMLPSEAYRLSDVPIYVEFSPILVDATQEGSLKNNKCGIVIKLSALEEDFSYEKKESTLEKMVLNTPKTDDIYYGLDVAYHFPNMILSETGTTVNYQNGKLTTANEYGTDGKKTSTLVSAVNEGGVVLRIYSDTIISADSANTQVARPTLCFIATASYGHDSGEVGLLCKFRDECLLTNPLGTAFVNAYYKLSPPVADFIRESEPLKAAVRVGLKPLVAIATNALDEDAAKQNVPWFIMFMLCGAGATATLIKVDKRKKKVRE